MSETTPAQESRRLLIVDDDPDIREVLCRYLTKQGFRVAQAGNGAEMRAALSRETPDLVLLDIGLPGEDGFELTRQLRTNWTGALIIVTGRDDTVDRVVGLELGADDYVTKPFDLRELLARMRSALRRIPPAGSPPAAAAIHRFDGMTLDTRRHTLAGSSGEVIPLSSGEYELLRYFVQHAGQVLSRDALMRATHGRDAEAFDRAIDVQVGRLRRKIEPDPAHPALIRSIRGAGYLFATTVTPEPPP